MTDQAAINDQAHNSRFAQRVDAFELKLAHWFGRGMQDRTRGGLAWLAGWFARAPLVSASSVVVATILLFVWG